MSIWDDPEIQPSETVYVEFKKVGDGVTGVIKEIFVHTFDDGKKAPGLVITTGPDEEKTLTAGQMKLKATLSELRPEVGDHLTVRLVLIEKRSGNKTLKHFDVQATRGGIPLVPIDKDAPPAVDVAALAGLTNAQRDAITAAASTAPPF